jgi:hypothetical protein
MFSIGLESPLLLSLRNDMEIRCSRQVKDYTIEAMLSYWITAMTAETSQERMIR